MKVLRAAPNLPAHEAVTWWLKAMAAALDGTGPALLPLPAAPEALRASILAAFDPESALERADLALIVPTSGSTGQPKGALLTASAIRASAAATHRRLGGPGTWVLALPLTHIAGLMVLARSLDAITTPAVMDLSGGFTAFGFAAAWPDSVDGPVYTALVPTQLVRLLDAGADLARFDAILLGGAAAPDALLERARAAGARVITTYGMSETCGGCVYDGRPLEGVDIELDKNGRISIGGPTLFAGYRRRPDLTETVLVDGRFVTEDLGRWASDGTLEILGRADDVVISGGVNVATGLVTRVISSHPQVRACLVVGVPDAQWGQRLVAVIEPTEVVAPPRLDAIRKFARRRLEPAALPAQVVHVAALPMLASGKPDRETIKAIAAEADYVIAANTENQER